MWWTIAGLILNMIGVILLFKYGMPYRTRREDSQRHFIPPARSKGGRRV